MTPAAVNSRTALAPWAVYAMFFASGAASLICEVAWFKQLQLVLGSSLFAVTIIVAFFFTGLGLGSWAIGASADRRQNHLLLYGVIETALGIVALVVTAVLSSWSNWIGFFSPLMGLTFAESAPAAMMISGALLLPPTLLMGASLPVLALYVVRSRSELAQKVGALYAINTFGAACGCLLSGFALIGRLGVAQSVWCAAAVYFAIGLIAVIAARAGGRMSGPRLSGSGAVLATGKAEPEPAPEEPAATQLDLSPNVVFTAVFISGFLAIAYEVLWFRLLTFFVTRTVYAFSAMLSVYLLGLVVGAAYCAKVLAKRPRRLLGYFAQAQLAIAFGALLSLAMLGNGLKLEQAIDAAFAAAGLPTILPGGVGRSELVVLALSFVVLIVPTTALGVTFPLAAEAGVRSMKQLGRKVGAIYALNTIGGVAGSLAAGLLLLPLVGSQRSFLLLVFLNVLLFFVLRAASPTLAADRRLLVRGIFSTAVIALLALLIPGNHVRAALTAFAGAKVLSLHEGPEATTIVLEYDTPSAGRYQQLVVNGISYASNFMPHRRYMAYLGHMPALVHPNPKSAVVIAVGTGTTAGSLTLHPELERIWAVDISPEVFRVAPFFRPLNHDFTNHPAVRTVAADGRHFLQVTDEKFDVLTFEPPPPTEAGVVNLYAKEFYELARRRMDEQSVLAQWVPLHLGRAGLVEMLIKTIAEVFPHVYLFLPNADEGVVLASAQPIAIDGDNFFSRVNRPELRRDLAAYGFDDGWDLLAAFVTADDRLRQYVGNRPVVTDNHPLIEQFNLFAPAAFDYHRLLSFRLPLDSLFAGGRLRDEALDRRQAEAEELAEILWRSGEREDALDSAAAIAPQNRFVQFLVDFRRESERSESGPGD